MKVTSYPKENLERVCPLAVVEQWEQEDVLVCRTHCGFLRVIGPIRKPEFAPYNRKNFEPC